MPAPQPEPWLRNTHTEIPAIIRAVVHALEQAREDVLFWCGQLSHEETETSPLQLPSPAFQMRHIAGSLDRLLTYAEGNSLTTAQLKMLASEQQKSASKEALFADFESAIERSIQRVMSFTASNLEEQRVVGRARLPVTLGGLLVHCAEHTQRHVGQAITTTKVVLAQRTA